MTRIDAMLLRTIASDFAHLRGNNDFLKQFDEIIQSAGPKQLQRQTKSAQAIKPALELFSQCFKRLNGSMLGSWWRKMVELMARVGPLPVFGIPQKFEDLYVFLVKTEISRIVEQLNDTGEMYGFIAELERVQGFTRTAVNRGIKSAAALLNFIEVLRDVCKEYKLASDAREELRVMEGAIISTSAFWNIYVRMRRLREEKIKRYPDMKSNGALSEKITGIRNGVRSSTASKILDQLENTAEVKLQDLKSTVAGVELATAYQHYQAFLRTFRRYSIFDRDRGSLLERHGLLGDLEKSVERDLRIFKSIPGQKGLNDLLKEIRQGRESIWRDLYPPRSYVPEPERGAAGA
jgi:hypothetical protein